MLELSILVLEVDEVAEKQLAAVVGLLAEIDLGNNPVFVERIFKRILDFLTGDAAVSVTDEKLGSGLSCGNRGGHFRG
jgi:hypothetical protein